MKRPDASVVVKVLHEPCQDHSDILGLRAFHDLAHLFEGWCRLPRHIEHTFDIVGLTFLAQLPLESAPALAGRTRMTSSTSSESPIATECKACRTR